MHIHKIVLLFSMKRILADAYVLVQLKFATSPAIASLMAEVKILESHNPGKIFCSQMFDSMVYELRLI